MLVYTPKNVIQYILSIDKIKEYAEKRSFMADMYCENCMKSRVYRNYKNVENYYHSLLF